MLILMLLLLLMLLLMDVHGGQLIRTTGPN